MKVNLHVHATTKVRHPSGLGGPGLDARLPRCCPTPLCFQTRLPRDKYVRVDANDYSINPLCGRVNAGWKN